MNKTTLLSHLPLYYKTSEVIDSVTNASATELTTYENSIVNTLNQFFVDSSDFTLERWEKELGIPVDNSKSIDFRRSNIKSKMRGTGTVTFKLFKEVANAYENGNVDVIENPSTYTITIKFVSVIGIPPNLDDLKNRLEEIKPAHVKLEYDIQFVTWGQINNKTWGALKTYAWLDVKNGGVL